MLLEEAKKHNVTIIGGSIPEYCDDKIYNTAMIVSGESERITKHRKVHLFDVNVPGGIKFQESETLSPGNSYTVYPYSTPKVDVDIGLGVCYDMRFPELRYAVYPQSNAYTLVLPIPRRVARCSSTQLHLT